MDLDEFATTPVPAERSVNWWKIAFTNMMFSVCLPTLITGLDLAMAAPRASFFSGVMVGSVILTFIGIWTSVLGSRTRMSSYMLARIAFGRVGSALLNVAFAISLLGWFGVNINLFGDAMARLCAALWGYHGPLWPIESIAGVLMTLTTLVGLRAINTLSIIIVPILGVICVLMLVESLKHGSIVALFAHAPHSGISFGDTVSAVVGGVIVGAVIMPDTCRFIERTPGAVWTAILTYFVSGAAVTLIGGLAGLATGRSEILTLMLSMGLGAGAFALVLGGSWILNALNLYSASLSIGAAAPRTHRGMTTLVCGLAGTLTAFLQILDHFLTFLFYLSIVFVPIASVIVVDFFLIRPHAYLGAAKDTVKPFEAAALLAWALGAAVAVLGSAGFLQLSGIAAVDAMVVSGAVFVALRYRPWAAVTESA